jgi:hypothetical protein
MPAFLVLLHHRPSGDLLGPLSVAARLLRRFLDVLVLALFLPTDTLEMAPPWHDLLRF